MKKHNFVRRSQKEHPKMKSKDAKFRGVKRCKTEIYIQWRKTSQKIQIQGVKRHKWRYIYIAGNSVKRYKETPVHKLKGTLQNRVKRYEENPSPWVKRYIAGQCQKIQRNPSQTAHRWKTPVKSVHWNRKTPVQRQKKNPSPQVKRYTEESRLKGAKATLMQLKLYKPPPPLN